MKKKLVLDACCGYRFMWENKNHPNVVFIDYNKDKNPDVVMDFRDLKFKDKQFKLIAWDPPHLKSLGETSIFAKKFGILNAETWPADLKKGFNELWRVLDDDGVLVFKWNDGEVPFSKVLALFPVRPLFGNVSKYSPTITKLFVFLKSKKIK